MLIGILTAARRRLPLKHDWKMVDSWGNTRCISKPNSCRRSNNLVAPERLRKTNILLFVACESVDPLANGTRTVPGEGTAWSRSQLWKKWSFYARTSKRWVSGIVHDRSDTLVQYVCRFKFKVLQLSLIISPFADVAKRTDHSAQYETWKTNKKRKIIVRSV